MDELAGPWPESGIESPDGWLARVPLKTAVDKLMQERDRRRESESYARRQSEQAAAAIAALAEAQSNAQRGQEATPPAIERDRGLSDVRPSSVVIKESDAAPAALSTTGEPPGYVESPADQSAYIAASKIVAAHCPADVVINHKQLVAILGKHPEIKWTRPRMRNGRPRMNRMLIHLADWLLFLERCKAGLAIFNADPFPPMSEREFEERTAVIRRQKEARK